ncbi:hypothetical protein FACS1894208_00610 [Clostridia bacterium]|nr:hypothetical protein FACS1894208_00610 [Clostridia bacterium]
MGDYYVFVLGYDLLRERLEKADPACDIAYARSHEIWAQFQRTALEDEELYSTYENLQRFVDNTTFAWEVDEKVDCQQSVAR